MLKCHHFRTMINYRLHWVPYIRRHIFIWIHTPTSKYINFLLLLILSLFLQILLIRLCPWNKLYRWYCNLRIQIIILHHNLSFYLLFIFSQIVLYQIFCCQFIPLLVSMFQVLLCHIEILFYISSIQVKQSYVYRSICVS